jgi:hypothetical protein|tara:strand:+ start:733 stop:1128 length:396 start_codon:yes stop_codon:yes gene_type:complete
VNLIDIDLFSEVEYGAIDFKTITVYLEKTFRYVGHLKMEPALGRSYFIGENPENAIKLDVFYTDSFIELPIVVDSVRMASLEEIIAMKVDVVNVVAGRKIFGTFTHYLIPTAWRKCYNCTKGDIPIVTTKI